MTTVLPGWYPDPEPQTADPSERYWDGVAWSHQVREASGTRPAGPAPTQRYKPAAPALRTPDGVLLASWWMRLSALLIDALVLIPILVVASLPSVLTHQDSIKAWWNHDAYDGLLPRSTYGGLGYLPAAGDPPDVFDPTTLPGLVLAVVLVTVAIAYLAVFLRLRGATPGKLAFGLQVRLRDQPGPLPWRVIAVRVLAMTPLIAALVAPGVGIWLTAVALVDGLWAARDPGRQTLHDKAAGTSVVTTRG